MTPHPAPWTLGQIAEWVGGVLDGPADLVLNRPVTAASNDPHGIAFAEKETFLARAETNGVGAILIGAGLRETSLPSVRVAKPREAFALLLHLSQKSLPIAGGIHPTAVVADTAEVHESAKIGPYAVVESGAKIGAGSRIYAHAYIGEDCVLGQDVVVYPHAVLYRDVTIGDRSIVHSGTVLGADGFGYAWNGEKHMKVPQVGGVAIGEDVEIGALTTIDRATAGETRLGDDAKVDNLVQIAHNCSIGAHSIVVGQVGLSGSVTVGEHVVLGGQVGVTHGVTIGDRVQLGGRSGVERDILEPGAYFGTPARPFKEAVRAFSLVPKLPELKQRIEALERAIEKRDANS